MKHPIRSRNILALAWFLACLALFLTIGVTLSISRQRALLLDEVYAHTDREMSLLDAAISKDLREHDYAAVEQFLEVFVREHAEVFRTRVIAPDGLVLAARTRATPAAVPLKREFRIAYDGDRYVTLELVLDLGPIRKNLRDMIIKNIIASFLFAVLMGAVLWSVLRKTAFIPIEKAVEELNTANAKLEERVAERTAEWVRANSDLKNEIAEREAAEQQLVLKERAIATSVNGIAFADFEGKLTYVNHAFLAMWGYERPGEVLGKPALEFWQSKEAAETVMRTLLVEGVWLGELVAKRSDGTLFDVQLSADVVRGSGGSPICMMASFVDVTERKYTEAELRKERDFTAAVLDTVGSMVLVLDRQGRIVRFNRACEQVSGYAFDEVRGRHVWDFLLTPEQIEPVKNVFKNLTAGRFPNEYENYWVTKDGTRRLIAWSNTCLIDDAGAVEYVIPTGIDITESRRAEEALLKSETKHRMVVENINEIIYKISIDGDPLAGKVEFVSGQVSAIIGYQAEDFLRNPYLWMKLVHPDDTPALAEATQKMIRERRVGIRVYRVRRNNSEDYIWFEDKVVPQVDDGGRITGYFGVARDITKRKQAEDALKEALAQAEEEKNKSAAIIAAIGDGISIQGRDFRVIYQNDIHKKLRGDHVGEYCYQAYERCNGVCSPCPVALSFEDGAIHTVERSSVTDRGVIHVEITASPLCDAAGEVIAGIEVARNITDRKKAEDEIRRSYDAQFAVRSLLQVSLENVGLEKILEKAIELILSIPWLSAESMGAIFLVEDDGKTLVMKAQKGLYAHIQHACANISAGTCLCGRAASTKEVQFADTIDARHDIHYEGMTSHGHYCVPILIGDAVLGVITVYLKEEHQRDGKEEEFLNAIAYALAGIIQRKNMEEEREKLIRKLQDLLQIVSRSREEWQATFDSITDMISIHDEDYTIIRANRAFAQHFNLTPKEVINKKCYELIHDIHLPIAGCPHKKTLDGNQLTTEEVPDPKTGKIFLVSTFPYLSPGTKLRGTIHIARDITEAKQKEMRFIMSERLASLGQMASGIAHEINNPLAAVAGCVDGLTRRIHRDKYDPELFTRYLKIIKDEIARSKSITTSMLSFVRKSSYEKKQVNLHEILEKTLEIIGYQGRLKGVDVKKIFVPRLPDTYGSEGELKQVLLAIITNALDAMEDRGILTVETGMEDKLIFVNISDTGPGIAAENLNRIFDPFFTTKSEKGGTGLGLSIANRIVAAHNGSIRLVTEQGAGATFKILLPV